MTYSPSFDNFSQPKFHSGPPNTPWRFKSTGHFGTSPDWVSPAIDTRQVAGISVLSILSNPTGAIIGFYGSEELGDDNNLNANKLVNISFLGNARISGSVFIAYQTAVLFPRYIQIVGQHLSGESDITIYWTADYHHPKKERRRY